MAGPAIYLEVDASDLQDEIERLRSVMTQERFERAMYGIFVRTGKHVRQILRQDLPKEYMIKPSEVSAAVKNAKVTSTAGFGVGCVIPIVEKRRSIGGAFSASGGSHGWKGMRRTKRGWTKRKSTIKGKVVRGQDSVMPDRMQSYGGEPPFRNLGSKLGKMTFTRAGRSRLPIMKVVGIAIPQMPMNRSEADVQGDIRNYMNKRMEHEFMRIIGGR